MANKNSTIDSQTLDEVRLIVGNTEIFLGYEVVSTISSYLPDTESCSKIFAALARHPSSTVREHIADKSNLDQETVELLSTDSSIEVLRNLVLSESAKKYLSSDELISYINKDVQLALNIVCNLHEYVLADINLLSSACINHPDPSVRGQYAGSYSIPKSMIKKLIVDNDPDVSRMASQNM